MQRYAGGCLCGQVRYEAAGATTHLCFCHCTSCRRAVGAPMVPWATFARTGFEVTAGVLTEYFSSPGIVRGFCAGCGTSLTYRNTARDSEIDIAIATLDDPDRLVPQAHIWVQEKLPWVILNDGLPQFATAMEDP